MSHQLNTNKIIFKSDEEIRIYSKLFITSILDHYSEDGAGRFAVHIKRECEKRGVDAVVKDYSDLIIATKKFDPNMVSASQTNTIQTNTIQTNTDQANLAFSSTQCPPGTSINVKVFKINFIRNDGFPVNKELFVQILNQYYSDYSKNTTLYGDRKQLDTLIRFEIGGEVILAGDKILSFSSTSDLYDEVLSSSSSAKEYGFQEKMLNVYFAIFEGAQSFGAYANYPSSFPLTGTIVWPTKSSIDFDKGWALITLIHETGHSFNLQHTFGGNCGAGNYDDCNCSDDGVSDTPLTKVNLTSERTDLCNDGPSMNENWMDYNDYSPIKDYFFTKGQNARMHACIESSFSGYYRLAVEDNEEERTGCGEPGAKKKTLRTAGITGLTRGSPSVMMSNLPTFLPCSYFDPQSTETAVHVEYGNFSFNYSCLLVPFVSKDQETISYKGKFGQITKITLNGKVIGEFKEIDSGRENILKAFSVDFQKLIIRECVGDCGFTNTGIISEFQRCTVNSISFSPSNFGICEYQIELECLEENLFDSVYGVLDPKNEYSFSELENGLTEVSHSISAKGFITGQKTAMQNAKDFVESKLGMSPYPNIVNTASIVLISTSASANDTNAEYSMTEKFLIQYSDINNVIKINNTVSTCNSSFTKNLHDEFYTSQIDFSIQGGKIETINNLRTLLPSRNDLFNIAKNSAGVGNYQLNPEPLSYKIKEETSSKTINISVSYDTNVFILNTDKLFHAKGFGDRILSIASDGVIVDAKFNYSKNHVTDITTAKVDISLRARDNITNKYEKVKNFYNNKIANGDLLSVYLFYYAAHYYDEHHLNTEFWILNPNYKTISVKEDKRNGTMSLSVSFENSDFFPNCSAAGYSISVRPRIKKYFPVASCMINGRWGIFDINQLSTEEISISGTIKANSEATEQDMVNSYLSFVNNIKSNFINSQILFNLPVTSPPIITSENLTSGTGSSFYNNFNLSYKVDTEPVKID